MIRRAKPDSDELLSWETDRMESRCAQALRKNATDAERRLWRRLRLCRFGGAKFRRQQPLGRYIVDFVALDARLIVELDGGQHAEATEEDSARDGWLQSQGFRVLRFWNNEVFENLEGVLETIRAEAMKGPPPR